MTVFKRTPVLTKQEIVYRTDDNQEFTEEREAAVWQLARDLEKALGTGAIECVDIINLLQEQNLLADDWWE